MRLQLEWSRPLALRDGTRQNMIYVLDSTKVPDVSGVYIFGRRWGRDFEALYVGKATRLRGRVKGQLNNLRLMQHLRNAKGGKRILMSGKMIARPGQRLDKSLVLIERALIRYFLSEGHDLVNKQGTRLRQHEVVSTGKHPKQFIPSPMYLEKSKGH